MMFRRYIRKTFNYEEPAILGSIKTRIISYKLQVADLHGSHLRGSVTVAEDKSANMAVF